MTTDNEGEPMTLTDPAVKWTECPDCGREGNYDERGVYACPAGHQWWQVPATNAPNIVEYVKASEVKPGDRLLILTTIFTVTAVTPYSLAVAKGRGVEDKIVTTSSPTVDEGRWRVLHIQTNYTGLVRFPAEDIARLAHIGQTPKPGPQPPSKPIDDHMVA